MKAFARIKNEIWYVDLAYVDKIAKDDIGGKYLLIRKDPFDRTVVAKGMKTKDSKETVDALDYDYKKRTNPRKLESTREQNLLESLKLSVQLN